MRFTKFVTLLAVSSYDSMGVDAAGATEALKAIEILASNAKPAAEEFKNVLMDVIGSKEYQTFIRDSLHITPEGVLPYLKSMDAVIRNVMGSKAANEVLSLLGGSSVTGASTSVAGNLSEMQLIMKFIADATQAVGPMEASLNQILADLKSSNLEAAVEVLKTQFLPEIAGLTNDAIAAIPAGHSHIADQWRDALVAMNHDALTFSQTQITADTLTQFTNKMIVLVGNLTGLSKLAGEVVASSSTAPPAADATTQQLQAQAIETGVQCACTTGFSIFRSCCNSKAVTKSVVDPAAAPVSTAVTTPNAEAAPTGLTADIEAALKLATFIEATVHTISSLIAEVKVVKNDHAAWTNFEWRVAVCFLQLLNKAAIDNDYVKIYDTIRAHSRSITSTLVQAATATDLSTVETTITALLNELQIQLQDAAPKNV